MINTKMSGNSEKLAETGESILVNAEKSSTLIEETVIPLLAERVVVNPQKQKLGEVIVYKRIVTHVVEVPVRRETLIVEQVGSEPRLLAEIDLTSGEISSGESISNYAVKNGKGRLTVSGEFDSLSIASLLLSAIALESDHGCDRVKLELTVENELQQQKCQEWINRFSQVP
jgi:hypothetical protein